MGEEGAGEAQREEEEEATMGPQETGQWKTEKEE